MLAAFLVGLPAASGAAADHSCNGLAATIVGTSEGEVIRGTPGADVIVGLGGNDVIRGFGGDDVICGGRGSDVLRGGAGVDVLVGGPGRDVLHPGEGGGEGACCEATDGGGGKDRIVVTDPTTDPDWSVFIGGPGADWLDLRSLPGEKLLAEVDLGSGYVLVYELVTNFPLLGGAGLHSIENVYGAPFANTILGDDGPNRLIGGAVADNLLGRGGDDVLRGLAGRDFIEGGTGDDSIYGDRGRDWLVGDRGSDTLRGGAHNDRLLGGDAGAGYHDPPELNSDTLLGGGGSNDGCTHNPTDTVRLGCEYEIVP